jgi:succinyl-diaminopimelate desuccinylase
VLAKLQERGIDMDIDLLQECHSSMVSEDHPVAGALAECIDAVTGTRPDFTMCPGALEIRWYARKGIPAFAYGPGLLEVSHGPHEAIDIESIYQNALIYALAAVRLLS